MKTEKRRKESTAKYQQWLIDKEKEAMEREMKEFHDLMHKKIAKKEGKDEEESSGPRSRTSSVKK